MGKKGKSSINNNEENNNTNNEIEEVKEVQEEKKEEIDYTQEGTIYGLEEDLEKEEKERIKRKAFSKKYRLLVVVLVLLIFAISSFFKYKGEYLRFEEIGENFAKVYINKFNTGCKFFVSSFIAIFIAVFITNLITKKGLSVFFKEDNQKVPKLLNKTIAFIFGIIGGLISVKTLLPSYLEFMNSAWFGKNDPIFGMDIGIYLFKIPFILNVLLFLMGFIIVLTIYIGVYYVFSFNKFFDGIEGDTLKNSLFLKQLIAAIIIFTLIGCAYIVIRTQTILNQNMVTIEDDSHTDLIGASLTDVTVKVWGYRLLAIVLFIAVLRLIKYIKKSNFKQSMISIGIVPAYMLVMFIIMIGFAAVNGANEIEVEREYIAHNINNTKEAFGIDIDQNDINNYKTISSDEIKVNQDLINNIPVISEDITKTAVEEHQENSTYYYYGNTFLSEYDGKLMYITPRELEKESKITANNKVYKYTHGYSVVASTVNDMDKNGIQEYILSDYSESDILKIKEPRIYFGLQTISDIVVGTDKEKEFDYPITPTKSSENVYNGKAGKHYEFLDRLIISKRDGNSKLLNPSGYNQNSKIITTRNIIERAKSILPEVLYDENPYLVITNAGKLVWVIDGYTRTDSYPYSQKMTIDIKGYKEKINYIRNSVKVIIDAYDGTTKFYITDRSDPIIMTFNNIYPGLFEEDTISIDIKEHFVYPKFLYNIQAQMINMYHNVSADALYRADDIWRITQKAAATNSSITGETMKPYYTKVKLKDANKPQMGLVLTYNKLGKQNIVSYLVGTVQDGNSKLSLYKFSQESNVAGIIQMNNQIEQNEVITKQLESLNTSGTRLSKDMLLIPINNSLLYVEPVYQIRLNEKGDIPLLKKIIVASGNTVAIGDSLDEAIQNLFNDDYAVDLEFVDIEDVTELVDQLIKANANLEDSLASNDMEMIGKDINSLRNIISQLENARNKEIEKEREIARENEGIISSIFGGGNTNTVSNDVVKNEIVNVENSLDLSNSVENNVFNRRVKK